MEVPIKFFPLKNGGHFLINPALIPYFITLAIFFFPLFGFTQRQVWAVIKGQEVPIYWGGSYGTLIGEGQVSIPPICLINSLFRVPGYFWFPYFFSQFYSLIIPLSS